MKRDENGKLTPPSDLSAPESGCRKAEKGEASAPANGGREDMWSASKKNGEKVANTSKNADRSAKIGAKRLAMLGLLSAAALISFLIENLFPPIFPPAPYLRPGLSNWFILFALVVYGKREGALVLAVKTLAGALISGRISSLAVSAAGGAASYLAMAILLSAGKNKCGFAAISACGGAIGNLCRTVVAMLLTGTEGLFYLFPAGVCFGAVTGAVLGATLQLLFYALPLSAIEKLCNV